MEHFVTSHQGIVATADLAAELLGEQVEVDQPVPGDPPLVVRPKADALAHSVEAAASWLAARSEAVDQALARYGALHLRGFPIGDTDAFAQMVSHYRSHGAGYLGGATPRESIKGPVYEATQVAAEITILLHQEMAYLHDYPVKLAFYCNSPAETGGATTVGDFRRFQAGLPPEFIRQLGQKGVTYHRNFRVPGVAHPCDAHPLPYHATLVQGFGTEDRRPIEAACDRLGMTWEWEVDGSLTTHLTKSAFAVHHLTSEQVYFNHILTQIVAPPWLRDDLYEIYLDIYDRAGRTRPYHVTYGDGSGVDMRDHNMVTEGIDAITTEPEWRAGDVLLIDNVYTGHGRTPYTGTRDVQVALID